MPNRRVLSVSLTITMLVIGCGTNPTPHTPAATTGGRAPQHSVIPLPASIQISAGSGFNITAATAILYEPSDDPRVAATAAQLGRLLAGALETPPPVRPASGSPPPGSIFLTARAANAGDEGY